MDTTFLISFFIGIIAILPGIIAMLNMAKKDKLLELNMTAGHFHKINNDRINALETCIEKNKSINITNDLWKMMYEKPVIVRCEHCKSPNIITSLTCIQCGAPLGD